MGIRGPKRQPNARHRGARIAISPRHTQQCDELRTEGQSRADVVELAIEHLAKLMKCQILPVEDANK